MLAACLVFIIQQQHAAACKQHRFLFTAPVQLQCCHYFLVFHCRAFDFDSNEEWRAHLRNVELPASATDVALLKVKAKWYKKVVVSSSFFARQGFNVAASLGITTAGLALCV
jgi:hypothetical protein